MLWKHPIPVMEVGDQQRNCWAVKLWFSMLSVRFTVCALASLFVCSPLNISVWNNNVLWFESNQQMLIFFQYLRSVGWSYLYTWPNTLVTTVRDSRCKIRSEWGPRQIYGEIMSGSMLAPMFLQRLECCIWFAVKLCIFFEENPEQWKLIK